ncbi:MAG: hypothetical protein IKL70_03750 [Oscillospiraceae bacterium]|nr:hypothetical protein [Oscillospiraceae bacterium]
MSGQLLEITNIPIKLDISVNHAQLSPIDKTAAPSATANPIKSPAEMRALMENSRNTDVFVQSSDSKIELSYNAVAKISRPPVSQNNELVSKTGELEEIYQNSNLNEVMQKVASVRENNMSWNNGTLNLNYSAEQLGMKFEPDTVGFEFTPGSIDITVEQFPEVKIEYVGDPIVIPIGKED